MKMTTETQRPPKNEEWRLTETDPPKMIHFVDSEEIDYNYKLGHVHGLSVDVLVSYVDPPEGMVHEASVYIPFQGRLKWTMLETGKEMGEPKFWREK